MDLETDIKSIKNVSSFWSSSDYYFMEIDSIDQISTEKSSLLTLNNHCLVKIFQFLDLFDIVSLSETCSGLRDIVYHDFYYKKSKEEIVKMLSVIGDNIVSVEIHSAKLFVIEFTRINGNDLHRMELRNCNKLLLLENFRNIKSIKCNGYNEQFLEVLKMTPELTHLHLENVINNHSVKNQFQPLHFLNNLTTFSFKSSENCNQLLVELAKNLHIVNLRLDMDFNVGTFFIIRLFRKLEVLTMIGIRNDRLLETTNFPPKIKHLNLYGIQISCKIFLSIVKKLELLDEFNVGHGCIFSDFNKCK